ncbi:Seryl-tRNA synthetase [Trichuris trichiura]|uniref:Dihydropteridine reductase n=1 Tax=Trichuris trichiura TaxID=36087 RepID=A0A077Z9B5_TRITR|nr:Seryl-tRNA synthetase [Trichuris trichiura]
MAVQDRIIIYGGTGALGSHLVQFFSQKKWWTCSIGKKKNDLASCNVLVEDTEEFVKQADAVVSEVRNAVNGSKVDAILCVAGGWVGGNASGKNFFNSCSTVWKQSVWTSAIAAHLGSLFLKDDGLLVLTGAFGALNATPGMVAYGMAKAAVHQMTKSLGEQKSGLPPEASAVCILPEVLDTPANRSAMPKAKFSNWTPLDFVASTLYKWIGSPSERPHSGSLMHFKTQDALKPYEVCSIQRSKTDILEALASTVGNDPTASHYMYQDDPYLLPTSAASKRAYGLGKEAGRRAARYFAKEFPTLFMLDHDEPRIPAFRPKKLPVAEEGHTETDMMDRIRKLQVHAAIAVYENAIKRNEAEFSQDSLHALLELVCFYNAEQPDPDESAAHHWILTELRPTALNPWKEGGVAEKVFNSIQPKTSRSYSALINGMLKYHSVATAAKLFDEMRDHSLVPDLLTYNLMLANVARMERGNAERWNRVVQLLVTMRSDGLIPNVSTFNAVLWTVKEMRSWKAAPLNSMKVYQEMLSVGLEPSLGTFFCLLDIFAESTLLDSLVGQIVERLENRELKIEDNLDELFFPKMMQCCCDAMAGLEMANRINNVLEFRRNRDCLTSMHAEALYYESYLMSVARSGVTFSELFEYYDRFVPRFYSPGFKFLLELISLVEMNGGYDALPRIWSEIVLQGRSSNSVILHEFFSVASQVPTSVDESNLLVKLAVVANDAYERIRSLYEREEKKARLPRGFSLQATVLGRIALTLARGGNYDRAWETARIFISTNQNSESLAEQRMRETIEGVLPTDVLEKLLVCLIFTGKHAECKQLFDLVLRETGEDEDALVDRLSTTDTEVSVMQLLKSILSLNKPSRRWQALCQMKRKKSLPGEGRPELDFDRLLDPARTEAIRSNIALRKQVGNIDLLKQLWLHLSDIISGKVKPNSEEELKHLWDHFYEQAALIPNDTHPEAPLGDETQARVMDVQGRKKQFDFEPATAEQLAISFKILRTDAGHTCGEKSYFLLNQLAILETALIKFCTSYLRPLGFVQVTVPDVLPRRIPESCGLTTTSDREKLYSLVGHSDWTLSGTAEMGIASLIEGQTFQEKELPKKYFSVSRCYRPEVSSGAVSHGIYRVHEFTKVEMFACTACETGKESDQIHREILEIQKQLFGRLELHFRVLDMPSEELGAPAYRKFDIEAWMPGRNVYGEISSASNCTDFQSRRLLTKYQSNNGRVKFVHTVNGTACAITRTLIALMEQHQTKVMESTFSMRNFTSHWKNFALASTCLHAKITA